MFYEMYEISWTSCCFMIYSCYRKYNTVRIQLLFIHSDYEWSLISHLTVTLFNENLPELDSWEFAHIYVATTLVTGHYFKASISYVLISCITQHCFKGIGTWFLEVR